MVNSIKYIEKLFIYREIQRGISYTPGELVRAHLLAAGNTFLQKSCPKSIQTGVNLKYELADRVIDIPDEDIALLRRTLNLNITQAIALWLSDHDIDDSAAAVPKKSLTDAKEEKRQIMSWIYDLIVNVSDDAELRNPERLLSFSLGDNKYEITLTKKRS